MGEDADIVLERLNLDECMRRQKTFRWPSQNTITCIERQEQQNARKAGSRQASLFLLAQRARRLKIPRQDPYDTPDEVLEISSAAHEQERQSNSAPPGVKSSNRTAN